MTVYVFENIVIMIATWTDFFFIQLQWLTSVGFFPHRMCSYVYFNFCVNLAAPRYILVKWTYILEAMMHRFPSIWQTVSSNCLAYSLIYSQIHINMISPTCANGTELPSPFKLSVYISIFNKNSLLFHLFFLNLTCSCPYSYNFMLTATYKCQQNKCYPRKHLNSEKKK